MKFGLFIRTINNLSFNDFIYNCRLPVPRIVEENILRIAEDCIEKVACEFDPKKHKMGDNIHVKSRPNDMFKSDVTSQVKHLHQFTSLKLNDSYR